MMTYLILLFTVLPALELIVLIKVGTNIGILNTFLLLILTGVSGAWLARIQGFAVLRRVEESLGRGEMPTDAMLDGLMIFCGGIALLTPGFLTDIFGIFLLIPWTRSLVKLWLNKKIRKMIQGEGIVTFHASAKKEFQDYEDAEYH
jgi:UPF0716 protein FxsA